MAKRRFQLNEPQRDRLLTAYLECDDGDTRSRYQAVRLYSMNYAVKTIQELTGYSTRSLMWWVRAYQQADLDGCEFGVRYDSRTSYYNLLRACGFSHQRTQKAFKSQRPIQIADFQEMLEKTRSCGTRCAADGDSDRR